MPLTQEALDTGAAIQQIVEELNDRLFERRDHVEALILALLTGENVYVLGPPGTAKSMMTRLLSAAITGANYFEIQLDRQTPTEAMFGPIDILGYQNKGVWQRNVEGYAPTAHLAFVDEVGKAGPAVTDPMLTWMLDRLFHNGSPTPMHCPLISCIGASNEELEMPEQAAFWDRFLIRLIADYVQEPSNFVAMLQNSGSPTAPTEISLEQLQMMMGAVKDVSIPPGIIDAILELRAELASEQIVPSDRRWVKAMPLLQANALIDGRDIVDDDDIAVLRHVLWDMAEQIPAVERKVLAKTGPIAREAMKFDGQLDDIEKEINARQGQAVSELAKYAGQANNALKEIQKRLTKLKEQANRQGRATNRLDVVENRLHNLKVRVFVECLNVPEERARRMEA